MESSLDGTRARLVFPKVTPVPVKNQIRMYPMVQFAEYWYDIPPFHRAVLSMAGCAPPRGSLFLALKFKPNSSLVARDCARPERRERPQNTHSVLARFLKAAPRGKRQAPLNPCGVARI